MTRGRALTAGDRAAATTGQGGRVPGDAALARPEVYEALEERGRKYAIRIPANDSLERDIAVGVSIHQTHHPLNGRSGKGQPRSSALRNIRK